MFIWLQLLDLLETIKTWTPKKDVQNVSIAPKTASESEEPHTSSSKDNFWSISNHSPKRKSLMKKKRGEVDSAQIQPRLQILHQELQNTLLQVITRRLIKGNLLGGMCGFRKWQNRYGTWLLTQFFAKPWSWQSKVCHVCQTNYDDYKEHIESQLHHLNVRKNPYQAMIEAMVEKIGSQMISTASTTPKQPASQRSQKSSFSRRTKRRLWNQHALIFIMTN